MKPAESCTPAQYDHTRRSELRQLGSRPGVAVSPHLCSWYVRDAGGTRGGTGSGCHTGWRKVGESRELGESIGCVAVHDEPVEVTTRVAVVAQSGKTVHKSLQAVAWVDRS